MLEFGCGKVVLYLSILWLIANDFVAFVCECLVMGVRRVCSIYGYFSGCFVERVCWFPIKPVEVMWWLGFCARAFVEVYRERLR
jgi:hypothetical protein